MANKNRVVHVMLDLETLGTAPGCAILSIGATCFHLQEQLEHTDTEFYVAIDRNSNREIGLKEDPATLDWWNTQSKAARDAAFAKEGAIHISSALARFSAFISQLKADVYIWGNGADFDLPILKAAFDTASIPFEFSFRSSRCYRTLKALFPYVTALPIDGAIEHHAYYDARYQAAHAEAILNWIARFKKLETLEICDAPRVLS